MKDLDNENSPEELGCTEDSKFSAGETQCLKELDNLKDLDNLNSKKELDNHNCLDKLDRHSSLNELESHSVEELDNHDYPRELDDQNRPNDLGNHKNLKELHSAQNGKVTAVTHTDGLIDEQFNTRISNKEAMIMTSENDLVKESIALQSNGSSVDNVVPAELEMDIQVPLSLLTL